MSSASRVPRVSVIIPLYNMASCLPEALDSVLAQTFPDWEAWIVDDGSKDKGPSIAQKYTALHPDRIHYLEHPGHENRGVSSSRNLAIERSRGEFVAFLDADDVWVPTKLETQLKVFDAHPEVGMVYSSALAIRADGRAWSPADGQAPVKLTRTNEGTFRVGYGTPHKPVALFEELVSHCCLVNSATMVRRTALDKAGRFNESMRYAEDWLLYTCVAYHCRTYFIEEPLVRYRIHPQHFSSSLIGNELAQMHGTATFLRNLSERLGPADLKVGKLLAENRRSLFGRALSRAEEARLRGQKAESWALARFAWGTFPALILSRRTARFAWTILTGNSRSQRPLVQEERPRHTEKAE